MQEDRSIAIAAAKEAGAMMLFGEKYGDKVRMITFDPTYSRELCGGCHVKSTGSIGLFKIKSESAIAAGVRRIEAITAGAAEAFVNEKLTELLAIKTLFKTPLNTPKQVEQLQEEVKMLRKELDAIQQENAMAGQKDLVASAQNVNGIMVVDKILDNVDSKIAKTLAYNILGQLDNSMVIFGILEGDKCQIMVAIEENLSKSKPLHAGNLVREAAKLIGGGGGGQAFFATAGGKNPEGLTAAIESIKESL